MLDYLERPVFDLTPSVAGSEFVRADVTAQNFEITLPQNFTCENCTIRLLRQADEWSNGYRFWSCADIDIKTRKLKNNIKFVLYFLLICLFNKCNSQEENIEKHVPGMEKISVCVANVIKIGMAIVVNMVTNVALIKIAVIMENVWIWVVHRCHDDNAIVVWDGLVRDVIRVS